uniref:Uncharacterized protein n=1 Tax=Rhizophagus irregularis (strain DAOM 181602 / DAOM 197198 / MUCL 43194) TaxID=747089 RepID=U9T430_RHIID
MKMNEDEDEDVDVDVDDSVTNMFNEKSSSILENASLKINIIASFHIQTNMMGKIRILNEFHIHVAHNAT